jgi:hypothetical protein
VPLDAYDGAGLERRARLLGGAGAGDDVVGQDGVTGSGGGREQVDDGVRVGAQRWFQPKSG